MKALSRAPKRIKNTASAAYIQHQMRKNSLNFAKPKLKKPTKTPWFISAKNKGMKFLRMTGKMTWHFTIFLAAIEGMDFLFGKNLASFLNSYWFYDIPRDKFIESAKYVLSEDSHHMDELIENMKRYQTATTDWLSFQSEMFNMYSIEWKKTLLIAMDRAALSQETYLDIITELLDEDLTSETEKMFVQRPYNLLRFPLEEQQVRVYGGAPILNPCSSLKNTRSSQTKRKLLR